MQGMTKAKELEAGRAARRQRGAPGPEPDVQRRADALSDLGGGAPDPPRHDLQTGRMTVLAAIRPDSWDFPLFLHVLGAMILVGGLLTGVSSLAFARGDVRFLRLGYWSLLAVSLPGWILMRAGAEWIASREGWTKEGVPLADLARHRRHPRRPRRADPAGLAHRRRGRRLPAPGREGVGPAQGDARALDGRPGGVCGGRLGDGRQAELARLLTAPGDGGPHCLSAPRERAGEKARSAVSGHATRKLPCIKEACGSQTKR